MNSDEIHTPIPMRAYSPMESPFSQKLLSMLSPISRTGTDPIDLYSQARSPFAQGNFLSPFSPLKLTPTKRAIQKLELSSIEETKQIRLNSVSIELSLTQELPQKRETPSISCKCQKTRCLQRYCDCLAAGVFCNNCNCTDCLNTPEYRTEREEAIASILKKNPDAFKAKVRMTNGTNAVHNKGCHCSKSKCQKKYCECFFMGAKCTKKCRCTNCRNN